MILKQITLISNQLITNIFYNFYHGTFNFRKNEQISNSQQTGITNNIIETNTQTTNHIGDNYLNNNKIATVILNHTPSRNGNYLWTPEVSDNVVPGLDSMLTYTQSNYATLAALRNTITNVNNTINNEIHNIQTEINNIEIPNAMAANNYNTIQLILIICIRKM